MLSVPVRVPPEFASKVNVRMPLPVPLDDVCSHELFEVADQAKGVTIMSESTPEFGPSVKVAVPMTLAPPWTTLYCRPKMLMSAGACINPGWP